MTATQAPIPGPLSKSLGQQAYEKMRDRNDNASPEMNDTLVWEKLTPGEQSAWEKEAKKRPHLYGLAPTAPVEASGSEQLKARATHGEYSLHNFPDDPDADHSVWSIFHTTESGGLEVASGMDRATADLLLAALRPQPSGETREALDRLKMAAHVYEDDEMAADCATLEALLSARPLALRGQQGVQERCQRCGGEVQGWLCQSCPAEFRENDDGHLVFDEDTTPARAEAQDEQPDITPYTEDLKGLKAAMQSEAQDEGAAGEWPKVTDQWAETYCDLTGQNPDGTQVSFIGDGAVTTTFRDMPKHQIEAMLCAAPKAAVRAISAHPSPTPAADADRVRKMVEGVMEETLDYAKDNAPLSLVPKIKKALAVLKSEGK